MLPIRVYTFVKASWTEVIIANLINVFASILGQVFSFLRRLYCCKVSPSKQPYFDAEFIENLTVSHACNFASLMILVVADMRYWAVSPDIGVADTIPYTMVVGSYVLSTGFELIHDGVMFYLTNKSQPHSNVAAMVRSSRVQKVLLLSVVVIMTSFTLYISRVRKACLKFGAPALPNENCYD